MGKRGAPEASASDLPHGVFLEWEVLKSRCRLNMENHFAAEEEFLRRLIREHSPDKGRAISGGPSRPSLATSGPWVKTECYYNRATQQSQWEAPQEFQHVAATASRDTPRAIDMKMSLSWPANPTKLEFGPDAQHSSAADLRLNDFLHDVEERFGTSAFQCRLAHLGVRWAEWWAHLREPPRTGCLAWLVESVFFNMICTLAIVAYSGLMVVLVDYTVTHLTSSPPSWMTLGERFLNLFFLSEVILRLCVHKWFYFVNEDMAWNIFDLILVLSAVYENVVSFLVGLQADISMTFLRSMRLMKIVKALRVLKMLRFVSELRFMINSVTGSFVSLFWCGVMLVMAFFLFSLAFVQGVGAYLLENKEITEEQRETLIDSFGSIHRSMMTCFRCCTGGDDWGAFYDVLSPTGVVNCAMFFFFILFSQIALLNIVTGVFVENAMKLGQPELNALAFEQRKSDLEDAQRLRHVFNLIDADGSGTVSWSEFNDCVQNDARVRASLAVLGLGIKDTASFFKLLSDADANADVDLDFFVEACLKMKGNASSIDLQTVAFETKIIHKSLRTFEAEVRSLFAKLIAASEQHGNLGISWRHIDQVRPDAVGLDVARGEVCENE